MKQVLAELDRPVNLKPALPQKPLVVLEPSKGWSFLNFKELWRYRDLLFILTMRDVKVRYKQTFFGVTWAIMQPLFTMLIFTLFFGKLAKMPSDDIPYPLFAFAGLLPWTFFSNAVTASGNSLVGNSNLITKIYFPRLLIPISSVTAGLVDLLVAFIFFVLMMIYYQVGISAHLLALPVLFAMTALLAAGIGMWMSALNVKYRDIRHALPFLIQLGLFVTPIIYPVSMIPPKWQWVINLNPLAAQIEGYRSAFFNMPFNWTGLAISGIITIFIFIFSALSFRRMERSFADLI